MIMRAKGSKHDTGRARVTPTDFSRLDLCHSSEIGKDRQFFLGYPRGALAIGIMGLDRKSRYFFESKGLAGKVFQKQRLSDGSCGAGCQRASQSGMAAASSGPSYKTGTRRTAPIRLYCRACAGWLSVMMLTGCV